MVKLCLYALLLFYKQVRCDSENQNERLLNITYYPKGVYTADHNYIHGEDGDNHTPHATHHNSLLNDDRIANYGDASYADPDSPEDELQLKRYFYIPSFHGPIILDGLGDISSKIPAYLTSGAKHGKYNAIKDYDDFVARDYRRKNKIKIKIKEGNRKTKIKGTDIGDSGIKEILQILSDKKPTKQIKNRNRPTESNASSKSSNTKQNNNRARNKQTKDPENYDYYYYVSDEDTYVPKQKKNTKRPPKNERIDPKLQNKFRKPVEDSEAEEQDSSDSFHERDKEANQHAGELDDTHYGAPRLPDDYYDDVQRGQIGYIGKIENHGQGGILTNQWMNNRLVETLSQREDSVVQTLSAKTSKQVSRLCVLHSHAEYCIGEEGEERKHLGA